jgi:hypothetical protein
MASPTLADILSGLHDKIEQRLHLARKTLVHPVAKGDASEEVWRELFREYLPRRYLAERAMVVDSEGNFSEHIDVLIYDRQYSPLIFTFNDQTFVPAESVYAVFEAKQTVNSQIVKYAQKKVASVRALKRTSLPIPYAGGTYPPKPLHAILGGLLALGSSWKPALGAPFQKALESGSNDRHLDLGCVAAHGLFSHQENGGYAVKQDKRAATAFLFELIAKLQGFATVPMIDVAAYARWLTT